MSFYTKKELELSPSPNLYYSSTRTCEATPPVEGESEAKEKLHAGKQDTKKLLERMRELKAEAEKAIEELESELQNITEATNELKELRALVDEKQTELRQGLQLPANYKEETYVEQPRASNEHKKEVDNTERPLLKRIKGLFRSRKSTKRKKELQGLPLQMTSRQAPEAKTSQDELATPEAKTTDLVDLPDSKLTSYAKRRQREEFEIERSGLRRRLRSSEGFEIERSALRRKRSSGEGSVASLGTSFENLVHLPDVTSYAKREEFEIKRRGPIRRPRSSEGIEIEGSPLRRKRSSGEVSVVSVEIALPRRGSRRSLPTAYVGLNFRDELEDIDDFKGRRGSQNQSSVDSPTIIEHPKDQTSKEGSKVVFRCEARGKKKITYQWLKDMFKIPEQTNSSLVFDSVKLRDFGCYCCEVRCPDRKNKSESVKVLSLAAELNVLPCEGMRFKYLTEVFRDNLQIQESVEKLLQKKIPGLGGWKQLAYKYGMEEETRDSLEGFQERGKSVIDYLKSAHPELTVYEFCRNLKDIKRHDIIKLLSDHLVSVAN